VTYLLTLPRTRTLEGQGIGLRFPPEATDLSLILSVQTGSEAHLGSYLDRTKGFSSGG
jgi:hypothetical protein